MLCAVAASACTKVGSGSCCTTHNAPNPIPHSANATTTATIAVPTPLDSLRCGTRGAGCEGTAGAGGHWPCGTCHAVWPASGSCGLLMRQLSHHSLTDTRKPFDDIFAQHFQASTITLKGERSTSTGNTATALGTDTNDVSEHTNCQPAATKPSATSGTQHRKIRSFHHNPLQSHRTDMCNNASMIARQQTRQRQPKQHSSNHKYGWGRFCPNYGANRPCSACLDDGEKAGLKQPFLATVTLSAARLASTCQHVQPKFWDTKMPG